jgi:hypothetical protein
MAASAVSRAGGGLRLTFGNWRRRKTFWWGKVETQKRSVTKCVITCFWILGTLRLKIAEGGREKNEETINAGANFEELRCADSSLVFSSDPVANLLYTSLSRESQAPGPFTSSGEISTPPNLQTENNAKIFQPFFPFP